MSDIIQKRRNVNLAKLLAIAIMFSMALSAVPIVQAQGPAASCPCGEHDHEEAGHGHDACECGHCHADESCECSHGHADEGCGHSYADEACEDCGGSGEVLTPFDSGGSEILSQPTEPTTNGFPVTLDQSSTTNDCTCKCGNKMGPCTGGCGGTGAIVCGACGGNGNMNCPVCSGSGSITCPDCGGDAIVTCPTCGGDYIEDCPVCLGSGVDDCPFCVGGGADCTNCTAGSNTCANCSGAGGSLCPVCLGADCGDCAGVGTWTCGDCLGVGNVMCTMCGGDGDDGSGPGSCCMCMGYGFVPCGFCGGTGDVNCPTCGGTGNIICANCGNDGLMDCGDCAGTGLIDCGDCVGGFIPCVSCGGVGNYGACPACFGAGSWACTNALDTGSGSWACTNALCAGTGHWTCTNCLGSGHIATDCPACSGGYNTCSACSGSGQQLYQHQLAQSFIPAISGQLEKVRIKIQNYNNFTTDFHVTISDNNTQISNTATIHGSADLMSSKWVDVFFDDQVLLTAGATYFIGVGAQNYSWNWVADSANPYANGRALVFNGLNWVVNTTTDMTFETYMTTPHTKIYSLADLQGISTGNLSANYLLMNDIDASATAGQNWNVDHYEGFIPIGTVADPFLGRFEGDGHRISNLFVNRPMELYVGLFGYVGAGALINEMAVDGSISGNEYVGTVAGFNKGNISYCFSTGWINGMQAGGLVGYNQGASGIITNCYSTSAISGAGLLGGLIGENDGGTVIKCYSTGSVPLGGGGFGGLIGIYDAGTITNCFWDTETSGQATSAGGAGVVGLTTTQLLGQPSYVGYDFTNIWWSENGFTRPFLRMEWSTDITNSHQLQLIEMNKTANYTLLSDLNLSDITEQAQMWGTSPTVGNGFRSIGHIGAYTGTFNGNNHEMSNLYIDWANNNMGLFGNIGATSVVKDVRLTNLYMNVANFAGGIAGYADGKIFNCQVEGEITGVATIGGIAGRANDNVGGCSFSGEIISGNDFVGGIIGYSVGGSINYCNADVVLSAGNTCGGLVGSCNGGSVEDCSSSGTITAAGGSVGGLIGGNSASVTDCMSDVDVNAPSSGQGQGGLIGYASNGAITNCMATGSVSGYNYVGGLSGYIAGTAVIAMCYASGTVTAANVYVGGLVGLQSGPLITDSFARGNVSGVLAVGGLVGFGNGNVMNCYSTGSVAGTTNVGGFYGEYTPGTLTDCHWDTVTSGTTDGVANIADPAGITGHTTAVMMQQATFAGWDFVNTWGIAEGTDYPILRAMAQADLGVTVTDFGIITTPGGLLNYRIIVHNYGPDTCFGVNLSADKPAQLNYGWANPVPSGFVGITAYWLLGDIPSGQAIIIDIGMNVSYYSVPLTFTATVAGTSSDPGPNANTATITTPMNRAPDANDDAYTISEDSGPHLFDVLSDGVADSDSDGDALSITAVTQGAHGTVIIPGATWVTYTPAANYFGLDTFTYSITDGNGGFDTATVTVTVTGVDDAPVANNDAYSFEVGTAYYVMDVLANDIEPDTGDTKTITAVTTPTHGSVTIQAGKLNYTPTSISYIGSDTFNYTMQDASGHTSTAVVAVTITPLNRAPVASNDAYTVAEDSVATIFNVLVNDNDPDIDTLTIASVTSASHGTATIATGGISYRPTANYFGSDSFSYTINDGSAFTSTATVTITVTSVNDLPVISTTAVTVATVGNYYMVQYAAADVEDTTFTWALTSDAGAWLTINTAGGLLSGTPTTPGTFTVTITATDSNGGVASSSFSLNVSPVPNAAPRITASVPNGIVGQAYGFRVIATDADGDALTWTFKTNATWLSMNATGYLSGTPTQAGTFWALVTVSDGKAPPISLNTTILIETASSGDDDNIVVVIGPVRDSDGNPVAGARVAVTYNGQEYTGTTDANGNANIELPETALGEEMEVTITKDGYDPVSYTTTLDDDGVMGDTPASLEAEQSSMMLYVVIIVVVVAVIAGVGLMLRPKKPLPAPPAPEAAQQMPPEPPTE